MTSTGEKIRKLRKSKGLSIVKLAEMTDLSTGLISEIERDKVVPSINAMLKIVNALGVTMGYFFDENNDKPTIITKNDRRVIATNDKSRIYELLAPTHNRKIEFILITLDGCTHQRKNAISHNGEECGFVIKGSMVIIIEGEKYVLHEGDSIYFDSTKSHVYENYDDNECISIWAMTPPTW